MKGILPTSGAIFVVVMGILTMILAYVVFYFYLGVKTQVFADVSRVYQLSIISSEIKSFLSLSSQYSFDKTVYDVFQSGVLENIQQSNLNNIRIWKTNEITSYPTMENLKTTLTEKYEEIVLQYLSQLKSKQNLIMQMPSIKEVKIDLKTSEDASLASPTKIDTNVNPIKIGTSKTPFVLVDSSTTNAFNYRIADIFNKGIELLSYSSTISNSMKETNYCMSDDEIKNKVCTDVAKGSGETESMKWNFICESDKIEIAKEKVDSSKTLKLKVYTLVAVEDRKSDIFIFDGEGTSWKKIQLKYYIANAETVSVECCPGDSISCTDSYGCSGTKTCNSNYKWGSCVDTCVPGATSDSCIKPDNTQGMLTCTKSDSTCKYECK